MSSTCKHCSENSPTLSNNLWPLIRFFEVCFKIKLNRQRKIYCIWKTFSNALLLQLLWESWNRQQHEMQNLPINTGFYQHRRQWVGGGGVSICKTLSTGSGENQNKTNIAIQYTKHEQQRVQPFLKYSSFHNTNMKVFGDFLNNIRHTFFRRENVRLPPRCSWYLRSSASLRSENNPEQQMAKSAGWPNEGQGTYLEAAEFSTPSFT